MQLDAYSKNFLATAKNADILYSLRTDIKIYENQKQFAAARYLLNILKTRAQKIIAAGL